MVARKDLNSLNSIHHAALRLATGALYTSPVESLLHEPGEWTLAMRRDYLSTMFEVHLSSTPNLPSSEVRDLQLQGFDPTSVQIMRLPMTALPPWSHVDIDVDTSLHVLDKNN